MVNYRNEKFISTNYSTVNCRFWWFCWITWSCIASASAISSNLRQLLHIDRKTRSLLIGCASAGAIASIFKSPIAAIIFAIEVFSLDLTFASLLPLLIASVSSVITSYFFLGDSVLFDFNVSDKFQLKTPCSTFYWV